MFLVGHSSLEKEMVFSTHNCSGSSFSLFCCTKRLQKFRLCIDNLMSVQPAFQGRYMQPINNLQTSLRLKTVKYGGSAASFLHTSWLSAAVLSRLPSPTWTLQLWLLLAKPKADTTTVTLSLCACLDQSHHLSPTTAGASHLSCPPQPPGRNDSRF